MIFDRVTRQLPTAHQRAAIKTLPGRALGEVASRVGEWGIGSAAILLDDVTEPEHLRRETLKWQATIGFLSTMGSIPFCIVPESTIALSDPGL